MSVYPRNLQYVLKSLNSYSKQKYKLIPNISQSQSVPNGSTISVSLPANTIVDLDSFAWMFKLTTNAGWLPSKHIEATVINRVAVEINGTQVDAGVANQNLLWRRLADWTLGDKENVRGILNNGIGDFSVAASNTAVTSQQYGVWNWGLGFLATAQPRCVHTGLLGDVKIIITLAGSETLMKHASATGAAGFSITDNYFTMDTISLNDDIYLPLLKERLRSTDNPIEIPFTSWTAFSPGLTSLAQTTTGTLSTESLDMLVGTYQASGALSNAANSNLRASDYFKTGSSNVASSVFSINNTNYPQFTTTPADCFVGTLGALNLSQDVVGACDIMLSSYSNYRDNGFCHFLRLNHATAQDERVKSGLNLRGTNSTISWTTTGTEANITPYLFAGKTSVLQVKDFKQLNVIQ
jgi:hypothetical protein